jgi:hypothetical protein
MKVAEQKGPAVKRNNHFRPIVRSLQVGHVFSPAGNSRWTLRTGRPGRASKRARHRQGRRRRMVQNLRPVLVFHPAAAPIHLW